MLEELWVWGQSFSLKKTKTKFLYSLLSLLINSPYLNTDVYVFNIYIIHSFSCVAKRQGHQNYCHLKNGIFANISIFCKTSREKPIDVSHRPPNTSGLWQSATSQRDLSMVGVELSTSGEAAWDVWSFGQEERVRQLLQKAGRAVGARRGLSDYFL